ERISRAGGGLLGGPGGEILERVRPLATVVELGPGSGDKLARLVACGPPRGRLTVHLVDVSRAALDLASRTVATLDAVDIVTHQATYEAGLAEAAAATQR